MVALRQFCAETLSYTGPRNYGAIIVITFNVETGLASVLTGAVTNLLRGLGSFGEIIRSLIVLKSN